MTEWQFYSRSQGWASDVCPRRFYTSPRIQLTHESCADFHGKTGAELSEDRRAPAVLREMGLRFPTWFLYPVGTDIGSGPDQYV